MKFFTPIDIRDGSRPPGKTHGTRGTLETRGTQAQQENEKHPSSYITVKLLREPRSFANFPFSLRFAAATRKPRNGGQMEHAAINEVTERGECSAYRTDKPVNPIRSSNRH